MSQGIECLLGDDLDAARAIARRLDDINRQRGDLTAEIHAQALDRIEPVARDAGALPFGLCLFDPGWHQGVVGIIAGRLKERLHRPVIVFAPDRDGHIKGSGRSVEGMHLRDALAAVATEHPGLIGHFGGHAMAAGLSLATERFESFGQAFDAEIRRQTHRRRPARPLAQRRRARTGRFLAGHRQAAARGRPLGPGLPRAAVRRRVRGGVPPNHEGPEDPEALAAAPWGQPLTLEAVAFRRAPDFNARHGPGPHRLSPGCQRVARRAPAIARRAPGSRLGSSATVRGILGDSIPEPSCSANRQAVLAGALGGVHGGVGLPEQVHGQVQIGRQFRPV
jgi:hypothetical protein